MKRAMVVGCEKRRRLGLPCLRMGAEIAIALARVKLTTVVHATGAKKYVRCCSIQMLPFSASAVSHRLPTMLPNLESTAVFGTHAVRELDLACAISSS